MSNVLAQCDFYKTSHYKMYPEGTTKIYSNLTPRKSRIKGVNEVVVFGIQYFVLEYIIKQWNENFFGMTENRSVPAEHGGGYERNTKESVIKRYKRLIDNTLGKDSVDMSHIEKLWDLGYMPLEIKCLPEGTLCPIGIPCMTITNTVDHAYWLVNYLETILSCTVWQPMTSATIAHQYRKLLNKYAIETTGSIEGVQWQAHDFSMRGMSSFESACTSGAGHLLSFSGTDTIPAIEFLEQYYMANVEKELVGASVPATEHSVMCMGLKDGELATFSRLLDLYPTGILSVVSDTWDLWNVIRRGGICEQLKDKILSREGKLVIRPDSGDPVDIICGRYYNKAAEKLAGMADTSTFEAYQKAFDGQGDFKSEEAFKGVIECLWDIFGGTYVTGSDGNQYKLLDSHIGAIYGDSITTERADQICQHLKAKGFATTNIVFGVGSFTYQYNTRDTFGFAMKATYGEVSEWLTPTHHSIEAREIFKDPITDSGEKKSARGLLRVDLNEEGKITLYQQQTKEQEQQGLLKTIFLDGKIIRQFSLSEIRETLQKYH